MMSELTVELEDDVIAKLRDQAARKGISLEEEALEALRNAVRFDQEEAGGVGFRQGTTLNEDEIQERFRRLKSLGRTPAERLDFKAFSDRISDPIG